MPNLNYYKLQAIFTNEITLNYIRRVFYLEVENLAEV